MAELPLPPPSSLLQPLTSAYFREKGLDLWMLRLDLLHPLVSGNKWLKLSGWLESGTNHGIVTHGGPWSNHVHATAAYCHMACWPFTAIIKGCQDMSTPMLDDVRSWGGEIIYANRSGFSDTARWQQLAAVRQMLYIPMGGDGPQGIAGVKTYFDQLSGEHFDEVWCATGTGTTVAGISRSAMETPLIVACVPGFNDPLLDQKLKSLENASNRSLQTRAIPNDRFNKLTGETTAAMNLWWDLTGIPTDRIYTGKMVAMFLAHIESHHSPRPKKVLLVHTGGLQGNRSLPDGMLKFEVH